jgi:hypothetical protein
MSCASDHARWWSFNAKPTPRPWPAADTPVIWLCRQLLAGAPKKPTQAPMSPLASNAPEM